MRESESWCQKLQRSNKIMSGKDPLDPATEIIGHQQEQFQWVLGAEARLKRGCKARGSRNSKCRLLKKVMEW